jgi:hypothetical protein
MADGGWRMADGGWRIWGVCRKGEGGMRLTSISSFPPLPLSLPLSSFFALELELELPPVSQLKFHNVL